MQLQLRIIFAKHDTFTEQKIFLKYILLFIFVYIHWGKVRKL